MPRHRTEIRSGSGRRDELVRALARELQSAGGGPQPLVLEQFVQATNSRNVTVIWDKWKGVPEDTRSEVILSAYETAEGKDYAGSIAIADGVTPDEAAAFGLMPYTLNLVRRKDDRISDAARKRAIADEARNTVFGAHARELRYARQEDAEQALARLEAKLPGSVWAIAQEVPQLGG